MGTEVSTAYKRRKAAEAARSAARKATAIKARLERKAAEQRAEAALAKNYLDRKMKEIEDAMARLTHAQNEADLRAILAPVDDNPYGDKNGR